MYVVYVVYVVYVMSLMFEEAPYSIGEMERLLLLVELSCI